MVTCTVPSQTKDPQHGARISSIRVLNMRVFTRTPTPAAAFLLQRSGDLKSWTSNLEQSAQQLRGSST